MLSLIVDGLVDGDGGMNDRGLDGLLLDDRLDGLEASSVPIYAASSDNKITSWTWWWTCSPAMTGATE